MTEDDTYLALRRTPFYKMATMVSESLTGGPERVIKMWANCYSNIVAWHGPSEEWTQIYKNHGWTFEELLEEAAKRHE